MVVIMMMSMIIIIIIIVEATLQAFPIVMMVIVTTVTLNILFARSTMLRGKLILSDISAIVLEKLKPIK